MISKEKPIKKRKEKRTARQVWDRGNDRLRDTLCSLGFLGPSVTGVAVFFIVPFLVVVYYSVIRSPINPEFVFLDNFKAVWNNSSFRVAAAIRPSSPPSRSLWRWC